LPFRLPFGAPPRAPWKRQTVQPFKPDMDIPSPPADSDFFKIFRLENAGLYSAEPPPILIFQDIQIRVCVDFARKPDQVAVIFDEHLPRFTPLLWRCREEGGQHLAIATLFCRRF
jgi:hypothetical protein